MVYIHIPPPRATERSPAAGCREQAGLTRPGRSCHCAQLVLSHTGTRPRAGMPALCLSPGDSEGGGALRPTHCSCLAVLFKKTITSLARASGFSSTKWVTARIHSKKQLRRCKMPGTLRRRRVNWQLPLPACRLALTAKPRERRERNRRSCPTLTVFPSALAEGV